MVFGVKEADRMPQGRISFPTNCGIHLILRIDAAYEPPWMDLRRVCDFTLTRHRPNMEGIH